MTLHQKIYNKILLVLNKIRNFIENENNSNMNTNGEAHFLRSLNEFYKKNMIVIDVGSASGAYSSFLKNAEIYSFDGRQNYIISDNDGVKKFYIRIKFPELSSVNRLSSLDSKYGPIKEIQTQTRCLKTIIKEKNIQHISLLKIDAEGHELHILRGLYEYLRADFIDFIQFERGCIESDGKLKNFYELLEKNGFEIGKIYRNSIKKISYMSRNENFNYANYVAISSNLKYK